MEERAGKWNGVKSYMRRAMLSESHRVWLVTPLPWPLSSASKRCKKLSKGQVEREEEQTLTLFVFGFLQRQRRHEVVDGGLILLHTEKRQDFWSYGRKKGRRRRTPRFMLATARLNRARTYAGWISSASR